MQGPQGAPGVKGEPGPRGLPGDPGVTPDLIARIARIEQQVAAVRTQTFFETTAAPRAAPRTPPVVHLSDMGPEVGAASAGRTTSETRGTPSEVRPPPEARTTPEVRTTIETSGAYRDREPRTGREGVHMTAHETNRVTTEETTRMDREDRNRDDRSRDDWSEDRRPPLHPTRHNGTSASWPYWLLPLAALAGLGWYLMTGEQSQRQVADAPGTVVGTERTPAVPSLVVGGVDIGRQTRTAADSLDTLLQGIKDPASATAALPKLQETAKELDRTAEMTGRLSQEGRTALANATSGSLANLNTALDKAAAIPGVAPLLQPTLDQMRGRIDMIAQANLPGRPFYASAPADWVLLSTLLTRDVQNPAGEQLGTVNEVFLGSDGRVAGVIVGVGRDLGFGEKIIAIPFSATQMQRKDDSWRLVIDANKESLRNAPAYEPKH
jgi:sporulation protein YlmC with PRC-barrel domain